VSDDTIQLRDQVGVVRRRWRLVVVTMLACVAVGLVVSYLQTPTYVASTEVRLEPDPSGEATELTAEEVATEARAVTSFQIVSEVLDALGLTEDLDDFLDTITVEPDETGAAVLTISAARGDKTEAAQVANELAETYLAQAGSQSDERVAVIEDRIRELDQRIGDIRAEIAGTALLSKLSKLRSERRGLQTERDQLLQARADLLVQGTARGEVLTPAFAPGAPSSPRPLRTAGLAGLLGLLLGIGIAYLRDYFDDVVRDDAMLRSAVPGLPILGRIPHLRRAEERRPVTLAAPESRASEAYRALGVNLRSMLNGTAPATGTDHVGPPPGRRLVVTSATPDEGATVTAVNTAIVLAQAGLKVVLVDADLRRPRLHDLFDLDDERGLADALAGTSTPRAEVVDVGIDNLLVIPAGVGRSAATGGDRTPAELLATGSLAGVLDEIATECDLVVVDGGAVLGVADALELARDADVMLLAVRRGVTRGARIDRALQRLDQVGARVGGVVVTDADERRT